MAKLVDLTGEAEWVLASGAAVPAAADQEVRLDQTLRTAGEEGFAVVEYADGTRIELNPDTELQFSFYQPDGVAGTGKKLVLRKGVLAPRWPTSRPIGRCCSRRNMHRCALSAPRSRSASRTIRAASILKRAVCGSRGSPMVRPWTWSRVIRGASAAEPLVAKPLPKAVAVKQTRIRSSGGYSAVLSADGTQLAMFRRNQLQLWDSRNGARRNDRSTARQRNAARLLAGQSANGDRGL